MGVRPRRDMARGAGSEERLRGQIRGLHKALERVRLRLVHTEAELEQAVERYADVYHHAPVAYATLDDQGIVQEVNLTCAQLLGGHDNQIVGRPLVAWIVPEDWHKVHDHVGRCRHQEGTVRTEVRLAPREGGPPEPVELSSRRFIARRGHGGLHLRTTIASLAEQDRNARERQQLLVEKRSAELANEAKVRFLALLSHELRTPLTPILLAVEELARGCPKQYAHMVEIVRRNARFEARLIDDLLDATRIQHGKLHMMAEPVDVHEVIGEALGSFMQEAQRAGVRLTHKLDASQVQVRGDATRLQQVFANLLSNGLKFTAPGGLVDVRTEDEPDGVRVLVVDSGRGMTEDELAQLFRPFEQPHAITQHSAAGLGLGLTIVRGLVEGHGGSIQVHSDGLDRGTVVELRLPATLPDTAMHESGVHPRLTPAPPAPHLHVLVVEDHPDTAELLEHLLSKAGYRVHVARSCGEAKERMSQQIDLILSDVDLPDGTGLELLPMLRAVREVPAIALTGHGTEEDEAATRRAGFQCHLTKPAAMQSLRRVLDEALRASRR
jgi:PAS domain S-box-containing protein